MSIALLAPACAIAQPQLAIKQARHTAATWNTRTAAAKTKAEGSDRYITRKRMPCRRVNRRTVDCDVGYKVATTSRPHVSWKGGELDGHIVATDPGDPTWTGCDDTIRVTRDQHGKLHSWRLTSGMFCFEKPRR